MGDSRLIKVKKNQDNTYYKNNSKQQLTITVIIGWNLNYTESNKRILFMLMHEVQVTLTLSTIPIEKAEFSLPTRFISLHSG